MTHFDVTHRNLEMSMVMRSDMAKCQGILNAYLVVSSLLLITMKYQSRDQAVIPRGSQSWPNDVQRITRVPI